MTMQPPAIPGPAYPSPALSPYSAQADLSHLNILSICHWVWGGLVLLFSCFGLIYIGLGIAALNGNFQVNGPNSNPGDQRMFGLIFTILGSVLTLLGWTVGALTIYSGFCLKHQKRRIFSMVIAGINCISFPIGTTLGVFTFIVLGRASVKALYDQKAAETM